NGNGIYALNNPGTDLTVTTAAGTTVSGTTRGISTRNFGTGALTITANGNATGTSGRGIHAYNSGAGTNLTATTAAGPTVSGAPRGISARNLGAAATTITANGNVTGTVTGIYAVNNILGTDLSVTTAAGTAVSGGDGIFAHNYGTGAVTITANGNV